MKTYHVSLRLNYRCHPDIVSLLQPLFYPETPLRCEKPPSADLRHKSYLAFACSSIGDEKIKYGVSQNEAEMVSHTLKEMLSNQPSLVSVGVIAKFRNQV